MLMATWILRGGALVTDTFADPLVVACDKYLEGKRVQLWGQFSIGRTDERWAAAVWLAEQIRAVTGEGG